MEGAVELVIEDDQSSTRRLEEILPRMAASCDVLLGPYSTNLMKVAGRMAADAGWLIWNHGGSGDDIEAAYPGHAVSILTPTSRYAEPFLRHLATLSAKNELWIVHGKGSFGRQVANGAKHIAANLGVEAVRVLTTTEFSSATPPANWDLFSVGRFEDDVETVRLARSFGSGPRTVCAVAAGVREFSDQITAPAGIFGIAQWFPNSSGNSSAAIGPSEAAFLDAHAKISRNVPDYPAIQAVASAVIATDCARNAADTSRPALWSAAAALDTETLFGGFRIAPDTGRQIKHTTVLVRWTSTGLVALDAEPPV